MIGMPWQKGMLKLVLFSLFAFFFVIGLAPDASAKKGDVSVEGSIGVGIGTDGEDVDLGTAGGGGAGVGYEVADDLQARVDVSIYEWDENESSTPGSGSTTFTGEELRNVEIFLGGRYLLRNVTNDANLTPYVELGLTVNFLRAEKQVVVQGSGSVDTTTEQDTKIGVVPGIGIEYMATSNWGIGTGLQYHFMADEVGDLDTEPSFFSWEALLSYHF
jgi:opacity protein-like surface antigen